MEQKMKINMIFLKPKIINIKTILVIITLLFSYNAMAESKWYYDHWEINTHELFYVQAQLYVQQCVDGKVWSYTFIGLGMDTIPLRKIPFYDIETETRDGMDQKICRTGI